jgi:CheY-like chemotaxis protein
MPPDPVPIALLGFTDAARQTLVAGLQVAGPSRAVAYGQVLSVDDAAYVVADADQPGTLALLQALGRVADTVFVGTQPPGVGGGWLARPFTPQAVLRALDRLYEVRQHPPHPGLPREPDSAFAPLDALSPPPAADLRPRRSGLGAVVPPAPPRVVRRSAADRQPRPLVPGRALLVDDSAVALHFLKRLLQPYRLTIDAASRATDALELLATEVYGLVFLDVDLGEGARHEGLQLCHRVRHQFHHAGDQPPAVVMVSAFHDPVDQVRGTLAGAEAYLGKPLDPAALDQVLGRLGWRADPAAEPLPADEPLLSPHRGWR